MHGRVNIKPQHIFCEINVTMFIYLAIFNTDILIINIDFLDTYLNFQVCVLLQLYDCY